MPLIKIGNYSAYHVILRPEARVVTRRISMRHNFASLLERFMEILRSFLAQNDMRVSSYKNSLLVQSFEFRVMTKNSELLTLNSEP
jgi:hypothetical protein